MKKGLIVGTILLVVCLSLTVYNELKNKYNTNIHDITNRGSKTENVNVYLDATFIAGSITYNNDKLYVIFGDGVQYLVKIDDDKATIINKYLLDNPDKSYRLEGLTKLIPSEVEESGISFVNGYLNNLHNEDHEHNISIDDFYHYFGYVYLDTYISNNIFIIIIISITGVIGTLLIVNEVIKKVHLL